jgi:hypothetical protein
MTKIFESPDGDKTVYERDFDASSRLAYGASTDAQREKLDYGAQIILYEDTIREAASVARSYMLNSSGLDDSYVGTVGVEQAILKHFGLEE